MEALAEKDKMIAREQRRSKKLILELLPPAVIERLTQRKVHPIHFLFQKLISYFIFSQEVAFSYDAATVMFCSLYGFSDIVQSMENLIVTNIFLSILSH